jgi:hypothetical protein
MIPTLLPRIGCALLFLAASASARTLFSSRFEAFPFETTEACEVVASEGVRAAIAIEPIGTIDSYLGPRSRALALWVSASAQAPAGVRARVSTPVLQTDHPAAAPVPLTLGVDLRVSVLRPVRVLVESIDAEGCPSGSAATVLTPPVAGAFYRFTPDLDSFCPVEGRPPLDVLASDFRVGFELADDASPFPLPRDAELELVVDNLSLSAPSYYVSPSGSDAADGRGVTTAFATIQRAVDAAAPGDSIHVLDGTYVSADRQFLARIEKKGEPDRWITLRAAPGHRPVLRGNGWDIVSLTHQAAYIELRGLQVHGYAAQISREEALADGLNMKKGGKDYYGDPSINTNGFALDSRKGAEQGGKAHHVRFIGNTVREVPGGGISAIAADHITIEGNVVRDNCHAMRYAGSGISLFRAWDFDTDTGYKMLVVGNQSSGNRTYVPWVVIDRISDGNGIIIDDFLNYQNGASNIPYKGRTLVQNNLSFGNGGSGIHTYAANHVDIVNNTAYHNAQSPELVWRQIWAGGKCRDVRIANNLHWAQRGRPLHTGMGSSKDVSYTNNLMYGDGDNGLTDGGGLGTSPEGGAQALVVGHLSAEPRLVAPSLDPAAADFRLLPGSPAIGAAAADHPGVPLVDLDGSWRDSSPDLGAYEESSSVR